MIDQSNHQEQNQDWRISATLVAVWLIALLIIVHSGTDIPASMLAIATAFFILLIPAMNDLVQSIERVAGGVSGPADGNKSSGDECDR